MVRVSIIGCGRVGCTLAALFSRAQGYEVVSLYSLSSASVEKAGELVPGALRCRRIEEVEESDLYLLTMPDSAIKETAAQYAALLSLRSNPLVIHWSGALSSSVLSPYADFGARIGSIHPIKSFADPQRAADTFPGTWCGIEGDDIEQLAHIAKALGGVPFVIPQGKKLLYHGAAVFSSNYVVTLLSLGIRCLAEIGIEKEAAQKILLPLLESTYQNLTKAPPEKALTGPIARGDINLVEDQFGDLCNLSPELGELYRVLGRATAELVDRREIVTLLERHNDRNNLR